MRADRLKCAISLIIVLIMSASLAACSTIDNLKEKRQESLSEGVSIEDGWTITEDGFTYALLVENSSDKILSSMKIEINATDEEGKIIPSWNIDKCLELASIGRLYPGEKAACCIYSDDSSDIYHEALDGDKQPSGFTFEIKRAEWTDADQPHVIVSDYSTISSMDGMADYEITLQNKGTKDFDWTESDHSMKMQLVYVFRNSEGKITGGDSESLMDEEGVSYDDNHQFPVIHAGESVSARTSMIDLSLGVPEFYTTWNPGTAVEATFTEYPPAEESDESNTDS